MTYFIDTHYANVEVHYEKQKNQKGRRDVQSIIS